MNKFGIESLGDNLPLARVTRQDFVYESPSVDGNGFFVRTRT